MTGHEVRCLRVQIVRQTIQFHRARPRAQPSQLAFGEMPRRRDALLDEGIVTKIAIQMLPGLPVPDGTHRWQLRMQARIGPQSPHFVEEAGIQHRVKAAGDAFKVYFSKGREENGGYMMDHSAITYLFDPAGKPLATLPTDQGAPAVAAELAKWVR